MTRILYDVKQRLLHMTPLQKGLAALLFLLQLSIIAIVTYYGGDQIFHGTFVESFTFVVLARVAAWISHSFFGVIVLYLFMTICAFPPMHGFMTCMTVCGMAFGSAGAQSTMHQQVSYLLYAWFIAVVGLMVSACISVVVLRRVLYYLHGQWQLLARMKQDRRFLSLQNAIRDHGLVMAVLARFCPLPFCYTNLLLASLDSLSFGTYALSTFLTSPRLIFPLFMGARMYELSDRDVRAKMDPMTQRLNSVFIVISMLLGIGSSWLIWRQTRRALHFDQLSDEEEPDALLLANVSE